MKKLSLFLPIALLAFSTFAAEVQTVAVPATDVDLSSGAVRGTLLMPKAAAAVPVVLLIAGSGPTDRDGNSAMIGGANNSLRLLAEGLAGNGIASLRYAPPPATVQHASSVHRVEKIFACRARIRR